MLKRLCKIGLGVFLFICFLVMLSPVIVNEIPSNPSIFAQPKSFQTYQTNYVPFELVWNNIVVANTNQIYVIETANDLFWFSQLANGPSRALYLSLHYVLGDDIDYLDASRLGRFFRPVGFLPHPAPDPNKTVLENQAANPFAFQGTFDGQGFEISNLLIEPITAQEYVTTYGNALEFYSMFSVIGSNGSVSNVGFINPILVQPVNLGVMSGSSVLVGANHGLVHHTYYVDTRAASDSGLNVSGNFHLAGLVVKNYGVFRDSFVATTRVRSLGATVNLSTSLLYYQNFGTLDRVYFDNTIRLDTPNANEATRGLTTAQFQQSTHFSSSWFFNNTYLAANQLNNTYPILKGFLRNSGAHYIRRAADLVYMNRIINQNFNFNTVNFQIASDIDMASVSRYAIKPTITNYSGRIEARLLNATNPTGTQLYTRSPGDNNYFTILNLSLITTIDLGTYAGVGLFGSISGTPTNLNIFNTRLGVVNTSGFVDEEFIAAGVLAVRQNGGTITNVHIHSLTYAQNGLAKRLYLGQMIGFGNGTIASSSSSGVMEAGVHAFQSGMEETSIGGFIGYAGIPSNTTNTIIFTNSTNNTDILGMGFTNTPTGYINLGGFIGSGVLNTFTNLTNNGDIESHPSGTKLDGVSMGGFAGYLRNVTTSNSIGMTNNGNFTLRVNRAQKARIGLGLGVAGGFTIPFGGITNPAGVSFNRTFQNLHNYGQFTLVKNDQHLLTEADYQAMDIMLGGVAVSHLSQLTLTNANNFVDLNIDLSYIQHVSGVYISNQNFTTGTLNDHRDYYNNFGPSQSSGSHTISRSSNFGNITASSSAPLYKYVIKIAGIVLGKSPHLNLLRNTGNISVSILHNATYSHASAPSIDGIATGQKKIIVVGVAEEAIASRRADALYNGGRIQVHTASALDIKFHIYASGVLHRNRNTTSTITTNTTNTLLNDGYVDVQADVEGNVRAAGIVSLNYGVVMSSINAGDIVAINASKQSLNPANPYDDYLVDAGGIANLFLSTSTSSTSIGYLMNAINYGDIHAQNNSSYGRATAGGILTRNNRRDTQTEVRNNSADWFFNSQIRHAVNYGTITSYNERNESGVITDDSYAIAGGIVGNGLLRIDTSINYGSVYSKSVAGGIIGHYDFFSFARYTNPASVLLANLINYGDIRRLTNASAVNFQPSPGMPGLSVNPTFVSDTLLRSGNLGFGGIIGHIHIGTGTWNYYGTTSNNYQFVASRNQHWLNTDPIADIIGNTPPINNANPTQAATRAAELVATVYAVKTPDDSLAPYTNVTSYTLDAQVGGIFHSAFAFMQPVSATPPISNAIRFIPTNRVNNYLLTKIGFLFDTDDPTKGIFALGPTTGIGEEGLYLPDNFVFDNLNPFGGDGSWRNVIQSGNETLNTKITRGMKQLSLSLATNIDRAQLINQWPSPQFRLLNPVIDLDQNTLTFYVPDNAPAGQTSGQSKTLTTVYLAAGSHLSAYGAYLDGLTWRGTHAFVGGQFVASPGGTHIMTQVWVVSTPNPRTFIMNTFEPANYTLGYRASFYHDNDDPLTSYNLPATVENIIGPYGSDGRVYDVSGAILDDQTTHYGKIRVYAEAYIHDPLDPEGVDPLTWQEYRVRIVRLPDMEYTRIVSAIVNGVSQTISPSQNVTLFDVTSTPLNYRQVGQLGQITITYESNHVPFQTTPHTVIRLRNSANAIVSQSGNLTITPTSAQTAGNYDPVSYQWNPSTYTYTFNVQQALASGTYTLEIEIDSTRIYTIVFQKQISDEATILTIRPWGVSSNLTAVSGNYVSDIQFGMFYNIADANNTSSVVNNSRIINFTNLNTLANVPAASTNTTSFRPSYLQTLTISNFATLVSVSVVRSPVLIDGYRNQYIVTFVIRSESGIENTVVHTLTERSLITSVAEAYLGVNPITQSLLYQEFQREDTPSYRYVFQTANLYQTGTHAVSRTVTYFGPGDPVLGADYQLVPAVDGYTIDFLSAAPVGSYTVSFDYINSYTYTTPGYPLEGTVMSWSIAYDAVEFMKIGNSNSHMSNIAFTSDAVFTGLNTIIDPNHMTPTRYLSLLNNPQTRQIILIPTEGIVYNYGSTPLSEIHMQDYYIVGQVANTNLNFYLPTMQLPAGATLYRMLENGTKASVLFTDFSPIEENEFNYVRYRIEAEDYFEEDPIYGTHYTDYYIAVQDVTNNIYLTIKVHQNTTQTLESIALSFVLHNLQGDLSVFTLYSTFDGVNPLGFNFQPRNTTSGSFYVFLDLPAGYTFTVTFDDTPQFDQSFIVPETVIPRRYQIDIYIIDDSTPPVWGQRILSRWVPPS